MPWVLAMTKGLKVSDLASLVYPYPIFSEVTEEHGGGVSEVFGSESMVAASDWSASPLGIGGHER